MEERQTRPLKLIIAGGRDFYDFDKVRDTVLSMRRYPTMIIQGGAKGADYLGRAVAINLGIPMIEFPADWDTHGKRAGFLRNSEMAKEGHALLAFWDGKSKGTAHMISEAKRLGLHVKVIIYEKHENVVDGKVKHVYTYQTN